MKKFLVVLVFSFLVTSCAHILENEKIISNGSQIVDKVMECNIEQGAMKCADVELSFGVSVHQIFVKEALKSFATATWSSTTAAKSVKLYCDMTMVPKAGQKEVKFSDVCPFIQVWDLKDVIETKDLESTQ